MVVINARQHDSHTELYIATSAADEEAIKVLLKDKADIRARRDDDQTMLHVVCFDVYLQVNPAHW